MTIENVLNNFVASEEPGAIVLQGDWGVGKTYFWQHRIVQTLESKPWKKRYSYLSLFGINSLPELRTALAVATDEFDLDARNQKRLATPAIKFFWKAQRWISDLLVLTPKFGSGLARLYDRIGFQLIKDRVICFDDIERHGDGLALKDFLGLVSYLVEQRNCRVVVILNTSQLNAEQQTWDMHREKVFYGELTYTPSLEETVALGLDNSSGYPWRDALFASFIKLKVSNIRLVSRSARLMRLIWDEVDQRELLPETIQRIATAIPILVWSFYGAGDGAPPINRVAAQGLYDPFFTGVLGKEDKRTKEEKAWDNLISDYDFHFDSALDRALLETVKNGYPDTSLLNAALEIFEADLGRQQEQDQWHAAWNKYHNSVHENGDEIIAAFEHSWPPVAPYQHIANLCSATFLMRLLGRPDLATKFISLWVEPRRVTNSEDLLERELHRFGLLDDNEIIEACKVAREAATQLPSLDDAFLSMSPMGSRPAEAISAFALATPSEIMAMLDRNSGTLDFSRTVRAIAELSGYPEGSNENVAGANLIDAARLIGNRSPLNRNRVRNWLGDKVLSPSNPAQE